MYKSHVIILCLVGVGLTVHVFGQEMDYNPGQAQLGRDGWGQGGLGGYSQQYHYSAYPSHDSHHGLGFDASTAKYFILTVVVFLVLSCLFYPLLGKLGGHSGGWGWDGRDMGTAAKNMDLMGKAEKVLTAVEKLYNVYNKKS